MLPLYYKDVGKGQTIVLLHGFLETHQIWNEFAAALSSRFRVIAFDLPGFGQSPLLPDNFSISDVASSVLATLDIVTQEPVCLIGHSLGGYVSLAMVQQKPERFNSFGLFHSTAYADAPEKKEARTKTIEFVERNGAKAFTSNFVPPLFANQQHPAIPMVTTIANQTSQQTVVSYLAAMRDRPDRTAVVQQFNGTILFLAGQADTVIPIENVKKQSEMSKNALFKSYNGVGHMGMFEAFAETVEAVLTFAETSRQHGKIS
jgi:pimeloyl-ACP methyl ester carboxylesterase